MASESRPLDKAQLQEALRRLKSDLERRNWTPREPSPDDKLWRYMDLGKLVSLVQDGRLFFPSVTMLSDRFEGSLSRREYGMHTLWDMARPEGSPPSNATEWVDRSRAAQQARVERTHEMRDQVFVSCWYSGQNESAALWRLYGEGSNTVCLETSFGALRAALASHQRYLLSSIVSYVDFHASTDEVRTGGSQCARFFRKHLAFAHEKEVRVLAHQTSEIKDVPPHDEVADAEPGSGLALLVDLEALVQRVLVPPQSHKWYQHTVCKFLERSGLNVTVDRSILDADPYF